MHRRYRPWHYAEKLRLIRENHAGRRHRRADVMVGFPGETDALFEESFTVYRGPALHGIPRTCFPFSARPGTTAVATRSSNTRSHLRVVAERKRCATAES